VHDSNKTAQARKYNLKLVVYDLCMLNHNTMHRRPQEFDTCIKLL